MLETYSPVPMLEGEQLAWGITSKHAIHFAIGAGTSAPIVGIAYFVFPYFGLSHYASAFIAVGAGLVFAMVPVKGRPVAEFLWLTLRLAMRPRVVIYDRNYRIRTHRKETESD